MTRSGVALVGVLWFAHCQTDVGAPRAPIEPAPDAVPALRAALRVRTPVVRAGQRIEWSAVIVNDTKRSVILARALPSSDYHQRSPRVALEVLDPAGNPVEPKSEPPMRSSYAPGLTLDDFVEVGPGESFRPFLETAPTELEIDNWSHFSGKYTVGPFDAWRPDTPGTYRMRFIYDSRSRAWEDWELSGAIHWEDEDLTPLRARFEGVSHVRVVTDWVEITVTE